MLIYSVHTITYCHVSGSNVSKPTKLTNSNIHRHDQLISDLHKELSAISEVGLCECGCVQVGLL